MEEKRHATQITPQTKSKLRAAAPGVPCDPHIHLKTSFFCYFKHLPTCPGRTAGRLLLGSQELIPHQELSFLPQSPGPRTASATYGGSQAASVTRAQPQNSQKGNLNRNTKHLTFCFQSKTSVKKKKKKELFATSRLCFSWLKASQELRVTPLPWGPGNQPPQPPSRSFFQTAQLRAGPLMSA